ncbi:MAG: hypothetical protein CVU59_03090 [Deltaproteobacteria bacterium HGW-Deltaproteobacteria-17]|jgi:hypothetical protein|nr:MAG: hypothetical protein CVU59_03090 [Deltaproteobacteria bacterium HGW-Deltaproteobacteria-17]
MRHTFSRRVQIRLAVVVLLFLVPACTGTHTLRVSVPVSEAPTVGALTQPVRRAARDRRLIAGSPRPVQVGKITRVRIIGPRPAPRPLVLPFFAEVRPPFLVVSDGAGRKTEVLLGTIRRLEVDSTLPGTVWRPADYLLLGAVTLFSILTYGFFIMVASDD